MSRRIHGGVILAVALAAALVLASPANAAGLTGWDASASGWLLRAWQWLAGVNPADGIGHGSTTQTPRGTVQEFSKEGYGCDPNGGLGPRCSSAVSPVPQSDRGPGSDPNG